MVYFEIYLKPVMFKCKCARFWLLKQKNQSRVCSNRLSVCLKLFLLSVIRKPIIAGKLKFCICCTVIDK
jgi:hypothetical protein